MVWNRDRSRIAPESLKSIMRARVVSEHMGDHIPKIDQDPLARCYAFEAQWPLAHVRECIGDGISDRACLPVRFSRRNDQVISN